MDFLSQFDSPFVAWVVTPVLIIIARICDVSIGTVRIILVGKGYRLAAAALGFFEVLIWISVAGNIIRNMDSFIYYIAWGLGFSTGTYIGMVIESRISLGQVIVRAITKNDSNSLIRELRERGFHVTVIQAEQTSGGEKIIFTVVRRQDMNIALDIIKSKDPSAFYSVEDVRMVSAGSLPKDAPFGSFDKKGYLNRLLTIRR